MSSAYQRHARVQAHSSPLGCRAEQRFRAWPIRLFSSLASWVWVLGCMTLALGFCSWVSVQKLGVPLNSFTTKVALMVVFFCILPIRSLLSFLFTHQDDCVSHSLSLLLMWAADELAADHCLHPVPPFFSICYLKKKLRVTCYASQALRSVTESMAR